MADWSDILNKTLEEATRKAESYDHTLRVVRWNDTPAVTTKDWIENRLNVYVTRDPENIKARWIVTKIVGHG